MTITITTGITQDDNYDYDSTHSDDNNRTENDEDSGNNDNKNDNSKVSIKYLLFNAVDALQQSLFNILSTHVLWSLSSVQIMKIVRVVRVVKILWDVGNVRLIPVVIM
jgi:hypothetical protein